MSEGPMDNNVERMMQRVERLERSNRVMKFIAVGAVIGCIALNALPAGSVVFPRGPKRIDAQSFNLVSSKGVLLASLQPGTNGAQLVFWDSNGNPEMLVGAGGIAGSPSIGTTVFDGNSLFPNANGVKNRSFEGISTNLGVTTVGDFLLDPSGNSRLTNSINNDGSNAVSIYYDGTQDRVGIGMASNGPRLYFDDSSHNTRLIEGVSADDTTTSLAVFNTGATIPLFDLSALGDGSATTFEIKDHNNHARVDEGFSVGSGEIILLHDVNQNETFRAPCTGAACP